MKKNNILKIKLQSLVRKDSLFDTDDRFDKKMKYYLLPALLYVSHLTTVWYNF